MLTSKWRFGLAKLKNSKFECFFKHVFFSIFSLGFEDLMRAYQKALPVITKEELGQTPRFYIRCLVEMEDFINEVWEDREGRKNMSKNNSKSLSTLRQKLRKYNKDFEYDIMKFRENPDLDDDEEEEKGSITAGLSVIDNSLNL